MDGGTIIDDEIDSLKQIGLGVFVSYDVSDIEELVHALTFLIVYRDEHGLNIDDTMPEILVDDTSINIYKVLSTCERAMRGEVEIMADEIKVMFKDDHQPIFYSYLLQLEDERLANIAQSEDEHAENDEAVERFLSRIEHIYQQVRTRYAPPKKYLH